MSLIQSTPFNDIVSNTFSDFFQPFSFDKEFRDLFSNTRDLVRSFDRNFDLSPSSSASRLVPPIDLHETENTFELRAALPGAKPENISIEYDKNSSNLVVSGKLEERNEKKDEGRYYSEIRSGSFQRSIFFDKDSIDDDNINADYKNGILSVVIPKAAPQKKAEENVKKIKIN